jgi:hypothetical protein
MERAPRTNRPAQAPEPAAESSKGEAGPRKPTPRPVHTELWYFLFGRDAGDAAGAAGYCPIAISRHPESFSEPSRIRRNSGE